MPVVSRWIVTQEREVEVTAENPAEAVRLADILFRGGKLERKDGIVVPGPIRIIDMHAREPY